MQNFGNGKSTFGMDANLVALLCYLGNLVCALGLILSIITVVQDKTNKLARFHAFQSILLTVIGFVVAIVLYIGLFVGIVVDSQIGVPLFSGLLGLVLTVFGLGVFIMQIIAAVKGFQGEIFKIPVVGNLADKYSN